MGSHGNIGTYQIISTKSFDFVVYWSYRALELLILITAGYSRVYDKRQNILEYCTVMPGGFCIRAARRHDTEHTTMATFVQCPSHVLVVVRRLRLLRCLPLAMCGCCFVVPKAEFQFERGLKDNKTMIL